MNQLQHQTTQLSLFFPWPGLAQHRQAAQQARALLDQATALGPAFSALGAQRKELAQRTKEPNWEDPSWATLEDCQPALVKKLHVSRLCLKYKFKKRRFLKSILVGLKIYVFLLIHVRKLQCTVEVNV